MISKKTTAALAAFLLYITTAAAQYIYRGKVIDETTRQPVEYAGVRANVPGKAAATDRFGNFRFSLPADSAALTISFMGYATKQVTVKPGAGRTVITLSRGQIDLAEVVISPALSNNSFHTLSAIDLNLRPVNSSQDLMRLVPGLFIAQHMGGGKAEQIFVRGFDADHGTDLDVTVDGIPVNMVSHIHGQGYADLHFLIPETVASFDYGKGPYYTGHGDFTTAGYLSYATKNAIDKSVLSLEGGRFNTFRALMLIDLLGQKAKQKGEDAYVAGEYNYTDGPFNLPERYKRLNLFGKYTMPLGQNNVLTLNASTFSTSWIASGEIPERGVVNNSVAVNDSGNSYTVPRSANPISRFGAIDSAQGGSSTRVNAMVKLATSLKNNWSMENQVYYTHYTFRLNFNSTFFVDDSLNGDLRHQQETRDLFGYNGRVAKKSYLSNTILTSALGINSRFDRVYGAVMNHVTEQYQLLDQLFEGDTRQDNIGVYLDEELESGKWLLNAGLRADYFKFGFNNSASTSVTVSPKVNLQYTATNNLQFYLKTGKGFHSNKAAAVIENNALQTLPAAYGADLGLNWKPVQHLYINAALWYLYLQQEFVLSDDGTVVPGGKTKRMGADLSARYQLAAWLFADLNLNLARPRLADSAAGHGYLALAPTFTSTGGLDYKFDNGINGGISYRYMHSRPGNNTNTLIANGYYVTDLKINFTQKKYEIGLTIENLFNTQWNEFGAEEVSRLRGEPAPVDQMSFTPGTPFFAKLKGALFF